VAEGCAAWTQARKIYKKLFGHFIPFRLMPKECVRAEYHVGLDEKHQSSGALYCECMCSKV